MSQPQRAAIDRLLRESPLDIGGELEAQRAIFAELLTAEPLPDDVVTSPAALGGVPVVEVEVVGAVDSDTVVLYFHGGAYALGTAQTMAALAAHVGRRAGARVVSVDYRLAPEHPFPAAPQDALAAYRGLLATGVAAERVVLVGESAGAGLVVATLASLRAAGLPQPAAAVLLSPWVDLTLSGESVTTKAAADPALGATTIRRRIADYVDPAAVADPRVSPLFADLTGLPPLLIQVGSNEILLDDATRLAARAAAADVAVTLEVTPDVPHVFQAFAGLLDEADAALDRIGAFVRSR